MFDSYPKAAYETLDRLAYHDDFYRHLANASTLDKLERGQRFQEHGFPSWEAFATGRWNQALALAGERRAHYAEQIRDAQSRGRTERRLRVVQYPITPYVQWEMHVLRVRVDVGDNIRVLDARTIAEVEQHHLVPEVVILGDTVMYGVQYDKDGNAAGARRYTDQTVIEETQDGFNALYRRGEDFLEFFYREITPLDAPELHDQ